MPSRKAQADEISLPSKLGVAKVSFSHASVLPQDWSASPESLRGESILFLRSGFKKSLQDKSSHGGLTNSSQSVTLKSDPLQEEVQEIIEPSVMDETIPSEDLTRRKYLSAELPAQSTVGQSADLMLLDLSADTGTERQLETSSKVLSRSQLISQQPVVPQVETDEGPGSRPRLRTEPESPDEAVFRPREDILLEQSSRYGPGSSILTPTAFGKSWGEVAVGVGFQDRTRFSNKSDGGVGVGFGLGDSEKLVGLDVNISFTDLSSFFDSGIVGFKLHRRLPSNFAIAVGVNDALSWGSVSFEEPSPYGVVSKVIKFRDRTTQPLSRLSLSAGVGTGRYRTIFDLTRDNDDPNIFGSVALRVVDPVNLITEWSGQDLSVGLSVRPFRKIPLIFTPAFTDITGNAGDGWRFILGAGYIFRF